jgi:hypothetical protein
MPGLLRASAWRLPLEFGELLGKLRYKPIDRSLNKDINTWFDFRAWGALVVKEGMIAFHDVDDHAGTNLACRRILRQKNYQVWGYCPNLVALKKVAEAQPAKNLSTKLTGDR